MCKAVLLAISAKYVHSPLAVWVIAAGVSKFARLPHEVVIVEAAIQQSAAGIADRVAEHSPDVVGISAYIWNAALLPEILDELREKLPGAVITLGGPEAAHNAEYWHTKGADLVLIGEGEYEFPALLDKLSANDSTPNKIKTQNHQFSNINPIKPTPKHQHKASNSHLSSLLSQLSSCAFEESAPPPPADPYSKAYLETLSGRIAYLETSRGCPFTCGFCLSAGTGVRYFPLDMVKGQIDKLAKSGPRTIKLVDRTFNCNAGRAFELFEYIVGLDTDCRFHFEVAADLFESRAIKLLASAPPGRIQLETGLQSFFKPALEAASRKTDLEKSERNIKTLLKGGNIHIHVDLIAGLPYETYNDFIGSFSRAYALGAHTLQLGFLKLLHGSKLRERAGELGIRYSEEPPYAIISSPWLSEDDLEALRQAENALQHTYNKCRFLTTLEYVMAASGLLPYSLFHALGGAAPNRGTQLEIYAGQLYNFFSGLPGVEEDKLRDHMVCDWLGMVKGKNMPGCLKSHEGRPGRAASEAEKYLGRKPGRGEAAILHSGKTVVVDSETRNPVTSLYKLHII